MNRISTSLRRYGWVAYWLAFVAFTLDAAGHPGFVRYPERVPYPWAAALLMCVLLGAQTAGLNAILNPRGAAPSWTRVKAASGLAVLFALVSVVTTVTDMPGYYYAPSAFALVNVIVVPAVGSLLVWTRRPDEAAADSGAPAA